MCLQLFELRFNSYSRFYHKSLAAHFTIKLFLFLDDIALTGGFSLIKGQSVKKYIKNAENKDFL